MPNSLLTAVSGLLSHQRKLDVVANNLANMNTTAFKSQRIIFSDLIYEFLSQATSGNGSSIGGTNPTQIGSGSKTAQMARNFNQGTLDSTGQPLDFALQGEGFFMLSDGSQDFFTRAGAFSLDESGYMIDPATGFSVLRTGSVGEPDFQIAGDNRIQVPLGRTILGQPTTELDFSGVLNGDAVGPLAEVLTSANPYQDGGAAATTTTLLNDLDSIVDPFIGGDSIVISGSNADGTPYSVTLPVDGTTTLGDVVTALDGAITGASAALDTAGNLVVTADATGESLISVLLSNSAGNTGELDFPSHSLLETTGGKSGDTFRGVVDFFDVPGGAHELQYEFQKIGDNLWNVNFTMDPDDGTVNNGLIQNILFSSSGSLISVDGRTNSINTIEVDLNGVAQNQLIEVDLDQLIQIASDFAMQTEQNGAAPSKLTSVRVDSDGTIEGIASNGETYNIAQLAIALFRNEQGLNAVGDSYYENSLNSGSSEIGSAGSNGRGIIRGGQLESSNVDVAFEFTQLIVAQRGFSANARTITVADEILEELTNIIR